MSLVFDVSIESETEEDPVQDSDVCLTTDFRHQFHQIHQESASLKKRYITHAANSSDYSKIIIGLGNEIQVYDVTATGLNKYVGKNDFGKLDYTVSGVSFFNGKYMT